VGGNWSSAGREGGWVREGASGRGEEYRLKPP
jgi:hypothetical protein